MLNMELTDISHTKEIYTVTRLNREVRLLLEGSFPPLWIEGELSNFIAAQSGHWYFSLKDTTSQIRCAMFKPQNRRLDFTPRDGMHIIAKAKVSLYEGRGDFQLLIEHMDDAGVGQLRKAFEALKKKLSEAGLFDARHKKPLPKIPRCIGVVTSPTGAAIQDILNVLRRRFPSIPVIIYPTLVQGDLAAANIVSAIQTANRRNECDVLIVARGGGSLEDLWPFNEEKVAYAIHESQIPIISGIGHEIDFTIADFIADVRAPTPSAAAELVTPDVADLLFLLTKNQRQLLQCIKQQFTLLNQQLAWAKKHLQQQHPKRKLAEQAQQLDHAVMQLYQLQQKIIFDNHTQINILRARLAGFTPSHQIKDYLQRLQFYKQTLATQIKTRLQQKQQEFNHLAGKLNALSPLAVLQRGFAIATDASNMAVMHSVRQATIGELIKVRLSDGALVCQVKQLET